MADEQKTDPMQQLILKAWTDEDFKQRLLADPMKTLADEGANLPPGMEVRAMENTDRVFHLVLPARPTHLSDLDLEKIAAGTESRDIFPPQGYPPQIGGQNSSAHPDVSGHP